MVMFEGNKVVPQREETKALAGLTVKRTVKWCYNGKPDCDLYEVVLSDGNTHQLHENEMVRPEK